MLFALSAARLRAVQAPDPESKKMTDIRRDLARNALAILCILGLIGLSVWVLLPFLATTV